MVRVEVGRRRVCFEVEGVVLEGVEGFERGVAGNEEGRELSKEEEEVEGGVDLES